MSDENDTLRFPRKTLPDDHQDHTAEIIWQMRTGYRRHYGIVELPPAQSETELKAE
jgi:outer membrane translocation and assembly module TamA